MSKQVCREHKPTLSWQLGPWRTHSCSILSGRFWEGISKEVDRKFNMVSTCLKWPNPGPSVFRQVRRTSPGSLPRWHLGSLFAGSRRKGSTSLPFYHSH